VAEAHPDDARERFEALAAEVAEPVRRFLARRTDADTADDVLAETLLVCWRRLDQVPERALPWVYGVARNCLANAERGARRQRRLAVRITALDPPSETEREPEPPDERVTAALAAIAPPVGVGAAGPERDRRGARHQRQRREHPAAPGAREVRRGAAKDRRRRRT
jgi:RNA polymerase sigma-70 factor (ECF subfamily)